MGLRNYFLRALTTTKMRRSPPVLPHSFAALLEKSWTFHNVTRTSKHIDWEQEKTPQSILNNQLKSRSPKDIWNHDRKRDSLFWITGPAFNQEFVWKSHIETSTCHRVSYSKIWYANHVFSDYATLVSNVEVCAVNTAKSVILSVFLHICRIMRLI